MTTAVDTFNAYWTDAAAGKHNARLAAERAAFDAASAAQSAKRRRTFDSEMATLAAETAAYVASQQS